MATFDVCSSVNIVAGGSFQWSNIGRTAAVKVTPAPSTSWPLPQNEYDIAAGGTTSSISLPSTTPKGVTYQVQVNWLQSTTPGAPCPLGGNPKIVVGPSIIPHSTKKS